jgi:hypothetical protein
MSAYETLREEVAQYKAAAQISASLAALAEQALELKDLSLARRVIDSFPTVGDAYSGRWWKLTDAAENERKAEVAAAMGDALAAGGPF